MYATSAAYRAAVRTSHTAIAAAEVWQGSQKVLDLDVESGSVNVSTRSAVRRTCDVTLKVDRADNGLVPSSAFDLLTPFGNELRLYRGVQFSDGSRELVPLGVFVITQVQIEEAVDGITIQVSGADRSIKVSRNVWLGPYQVAAGPLSTALTDLLQGRWPAIQLAFDSVSVSIEQQVFGQQSGSDPWKDAVALAEVAGYDLYFDVLGRCVLRSLPEGSAASVAATYTDDDVLLSVSRTDSTADTFNGIVYIVESSWLLTPFRVEVWDDDPASPTYRYGSFGEVPKIVSQSAVTDLNAAGTAAVALLTQSLGMTQSVSWTTIVDAALDVNDVVQVTTAGSKVNRILIIDELRIPLEPTDSMSASARTIRVLETS